MQGCFKKYVLLHSLPKRHMNKRSNLRMVYNL